MWLPRCDFYILSIYHLCMFEKAKQPTWHGKICRRSAVLFPKPGENINATGYMLQRGVKELGLASPGWLIHRHVHLVNSRTVQFCRAWQICNAFAKQLLCSVHKQHSTRLRWGRHSLQKDPPTVARPKNHWKEFKRLTQAKMCFRPVAVQLGFQFVVFAVHLYSFRVKANGVAEIIASVCFIAFNIVSFCSCLNKTLKAKLELIRWNTIYRRIPKVTAPPKVTLIFCPPINSRK